MLLNYGVMATIASTTWSTAAFHWLIYTSCDSRPIAICVERTSAAQLHTETSISSPPLLYHNYILKKKIYISSLSLLLLLLLSFLFSCRIVSTFRNRPRHLWGGVLFPGKEMQTISEKWLDQSYPLPRSHSSGNSVAASSMDGRLMKWNGG